MSRDHKDIKSITVVRIKRCITNLLTCTVIKIKDVRDSVVSVFNLKHLSHNVVGSNSARLLNYFIFHPAILRNVGGA